MFQSFFGVLQSTQHFACASIVDVFRLMSSDATDFVDVHDVSRRVAQQQLGPVVESHLHSFVTQAENCAVRHRHPLFEEDRLRCPVSESAAEVACEVLQQVDFL